MQPLHEALQGAVGPAFEIGRELDGAGMSRVFLAREPALGRDVVVKVLPPDLVSVSSLQRFTREIQLTARLQHPHILPVITAGGTDALRYYIAPFIRGESLRARLAAGQPIPFGDVVRIADQLLNAIAFAHARGVIHRDIKPGNILLSEGHAILADFGIAGVTKADQPTDHADHVTGSTLDSGRIYVAPEQPRDEHRDLFAAAVVIHEMAAGVPATAGLSAAAIGNVLRARHPGAAAADVRKLSAVLSRALSVDPAQRYRSATEFRGAMAAIGRGSRGPMLAGVGVGGGLVMLALSVYALKAPTPEPPLVQQSAAVQPAATPVEKSDSAPAAAAVAADPIVTSSPGAVARKVVIPPMTPIDSADFLYAKGALGEAGELYKAVVEEDPTSSRAQLKLLILTAIVNNPAELEAARIAGMRALEGQPELDKHDRAIAEGFMAMVDRRFPDACAAFRRAQEARSSFESWLGLGECQLRDDAVVTDSGGQPSFRSSWGSAFTAYVNAARTASPNAPPMVYRRLMQVMPQSAADTRTGRAADNRPYSGMWRMFGDSLGFTLRPSGVPMPIAPEAFVASAEAARIGRDRLRPILLSWANQSPDDPFAHESLALLYENMGIIAELGDDRMNALTEIGKARKLEKNSTNLMRLAATHVRLLMRARRYEALADLADSVLAANIDESPVVADPLLPMAILTGRIGRATELLAKLSGTSSRLIRGADGRPVDLPPTVRRERADFVIRASIGVCDNQVRSGPKRLTDVLDAAFPNGVPRGVEASFMERPVVLALPCVGPGVTTVMREPGRSLVQWARAFIPADTTFRGEYMARVAARPANGGPELSVEGAMIDVLVQLQLKDSTTALKTLTLALDRIPMASRVSFGSEQGVASLVRGMALAGEVAAATGDRETAQRWSSAIVTLWRNADADLQPQVARLRAIARATRDARDPE